MTEANETMMDIPTTPLEKRSATKRDEVETPDSKRRSPVTITAEQLLQKNLETIREANEEKEEKQKITTEEETHMEMIEEKQKLQQMYDTARMKEEYNLVVIFRKEEELKQEWQNICQENNARQHDGTLVPQINRMLKTLAARQINKLMDKPEMQEYRRQIEEGVIRGEKETAVNNKIKEVQRIWNMTTIIETIETVQVQHKYGNEGRKKKVTESDLPSSTLIMKFRRTATMTNEIMKMMKEYLYLDVLRVKRHDKEARSDITAFNARNDSAIIRTKIDAIEEIMKETRAWETVRTKNREEKEARQKDQKNSKGSKKPAYMNMNEQKEVQKRRYENKYGRSGSSEGRANTDTSAGRSQKGDAKSSKGKKGRSEGKSGKMQSGKATQLPWHAPYNPNTPSASTTPTWNGEWHDWTGVRGYY